MNMHTSHVLNLFLPPPPPPPPPPPGEFLAAYMVALEFCSVATCTQILKNFHTIAGEGVHTVQVIHAAETNGDGVMAQGAQDEDATFVKSKSKSKSKSKAAFQKKMSKKKDRLVV
jgi:hypothetical protein